MARFSKSRKYEKEFNKDLREAKKDSQYWIEHIRLHCLEISSLSKLPLTHKEIEIHNKGIEFCAKRLEKVLKIKMRKGLGSILKG